MTKKNLQLKYFWNYIFFFKKNLLDTLDLKWLLLNFILYGIIKMKTHINSVGSQIVAQTQVEKGDEPNKPSTINL